jgi:hypothetical protein
MVRLLVAGQVLPTPRAYHSFPAVRTWCRLRRRTDFRLVLGKPSPSSSIAQCFNSRSLSWHSVIVSSPLCDAYRRSPQPTSKICLDFQRKTCKVGPLQSHLSRPGIGKHDDVVLRGAEPTWSTYKLQKMVQYCVVSLSSSRKIYPPPPISPAPGLLRNRANSNATTGRIPIAKVPNRLYIADLQVLGTSAGSRSPDLIDASQFASLAWGGHQPFQRLCAYLKI